MKKLFTLLAAALTAASVSAQEVQTVFHWQCDGNAPTKDVAITATGGTITYTTTDDAKTFSSESAAYNSNVPSDMKSTGKNAWKAGGNAAYAYVTLEQDLQPGDKIEVCGYNPWIIATSTDFATPDITGELTTGTSKTDYNVGSVTIPEGISTKTIYLRRTNGTGTGIAAIKITREVQEVGPFYAVVGTENLFGTAWNAAATTDYMKAGEDGIYTWSKQNVALSENAELKVIKKNAKEDTEAAAWYPENNVTLDGWTKDASYNVTVTFNPEDGAVTAKAERIITIESIAIVGDFSENAWDAAQGLAMTQDENKKNIWTLTIEGFQAEAKTYEYKATANGVWDDYVLPADENSKWTAEAATYDLVFTADTEKHELTLAAQKQSSVDIQQLYIVGEITGGWPTDPTDEDDGWSMAKKMTQDGEDASIWTLKYNTYITVEGDQLKLEYKAAADKAWDFAIPQEGNNDYIFYESGQYNLTFTANVEEKTLTLVAEKEQAPAFAENAIYAWQSPTGYVYEQGGTATGEGNINVANDKYYAIRLNGKNDYSTDFVTIELGENNKLHAGDQVAITAFRNKNEAGKASGAKLRFNDEAKTTLNIGDGLAFNNINTAEAVATEYGEPNTITAVVPEAADGATTIELTRSSTNTNLFITKIEITHEPVYTLVGSFRYGEEEVASFFGTTWDIEAAANELAKQDDGTYTISYTDVEFPAATGAIFYKVVKDHSWDVNWGFGDQDADYQVNDVKRVNKITFTFNPNEALPNGFNLTCEFDGITTAIATVGSGEAAKAMFNLAGQRVKSAQKGLYIVGGKKVVK